MRKYCGFLLLFSAVSINSQRNRPRPGPKIPYPFVSRKEWGAKQPVAVTPLQILVPFVHLYKVYVPYHCEDRDHCKQILKYLQKIHQDNKGWDDIAYNFVIGGDAAVYEGRGWRAVGAHAAGFNLESISIAFTVHNRNAKPTQKQKETANKLIKYGIKGRYITPHYTLAGYQLKS